MTVLSLVLACCSYFLMFNNFFKKKFLLQFFDDFNGVDHASVPRKLRSGMWVVN